MADASRHQQLAQRREAAARFEATPGPAPFSCGTMVVDDRRVPGGQRVTTWQPCVDLEAEAAGRHERIAERERELAERDRRTAQALIDAEHAACGQVAPREREHSPFAHRKAIAEIIPHRESGQLVGVRVVFKPIAGFSADWVRKSIACQQARWAVVDRAPTMSFDDPTLVEGADVQVVDVLGHVEVLVTTPSPERAEVALARARGELAPAATTAVR